MQGLPRADVSELEVLRNGLAQGHLAASASVAPAEPTAPAQAGLILTGLQQDHYLAGVLERTRPQGIVIAGVGQPSLCEVLPQLSPLLLGGSARLAVLGLVDDQVAVTVADDDQNEEPGGDGGAAYGGRVRGCDGGGQEGVESATGGIGALARAGLSRRYQG